MNRYIGFGPFGGECISVHNTSALDYFNKANYCEKIHVLGCLRMDPFLRRIQQPRVARARPLIVLFSFRSDSPSYFGGDGYYPPFRDSHGPLALLAKEHPEIDVLIKPKPETFTNRTWNRELPRAFRDWGVDPNRLPPNLRIDAFGDAQDLIMSASVVVALNSTTLVEAAIAGLPVILPNFRYLREGPHAGDIFLREYSDLFDVPDTGEELKDMVLHRLSDPRIPDEIMQRRRRLFADAVSSLEGNATERYVKLLKSVVADRQVAQVAETVARNDQIVRADR